MFESETKTDDRGQVGIGTLIVFIAMVLVAAIAAGVLINTAGFLQSSAEESGQQAAEQTTNRLIEVNTVGAGAIENTGTDRYIESVSITMQLAPGSSAVDLDGVTMQWVTTAGTENLISDEVASSGDNVFSYTTLRDDDGSIANDRTLNDRVDRAIVSIGLDGGDASLSDPANGQFLDQPLDPGQSATLTVSTASGGETTITLVVPDSLSGKSAATL